MRIDRRTAFTLIELLVVVTIIVLLIAILLPSLSHARELANRSVCASNLRGIAHAEAIYAEEDSGRHYANVAPLQQLNYYNPALATLPPTFTSADAAVQSYYAADAPQSNSVMASLWILVLQNRVSPKIFRCRSDPAATGDPAALALGGTTFYDTFQQAGQLSYSIAFPWYTPNPMESLAPPPPPAAATSAQRPGTYLPIMPAGLLLAPPEEIHLAAAWWRNDGDGSIPVASDMAPMNGSRSIPKIDVTVADHAADPRVYNSLNHAGAGQNVVFGDGHAEWTRTPYVGQNADNIFTQTFTYNPTLSVQHAPGYGFMFISPSSSDPPFDTVMVPTRSASDLSIN